MTQTVQNATRVAGAAFGQLNAGPCKFACEFTGAEHIFYTVASMQHIENKLLDSRSVKVWRDGSKALVTKIRTYFRCIFCISEMVANSSDSDTSAGTEKNYNGGTPAVAAVSKFDRHGHLRRDLLGPLFFATQ